MNNQFRKFIKSLVSKQPINYLALHIIKVLIALRLPFPYKSIIHRFPLLNPPVPYRVKINKDLSLRFMNLGNSGIENSVYFYGIAGHEPEMLPVIYALAKRTNCFLDIGANIGIYSLIISALNKHCNVYAFEPSPINREWCLRNIKANDFMNCHLIATAVSNFTGKAKLLNYDSDSSPTLHSKESDNIKGSNVDVDVTTIDAFIEKENPGKIDLVKIDVELAEPQVLEGMRNCLKHYEPIIICEVLWAQEVDRIKILMREYGYRAYHIGNKGSLRLNNELDRTGTGDMRNFLFTKKDLSGIGLSNFEKK